VQSSASERLRYMPKAAKIHYLNVHYNRKSSSKSAKKQRLGWLPHIWHPAKYERSTATGKPKKGRVLILLRKSRSRLIRLYTKLYVAYRMTLLPVTCCDFEGHFCSVHFHWRISTLVPKRHDSVFNSSVKDGDILTDIARREVPLQ